MAFYIPYGLLFYGFHIGIWIAAALMMFLLVTYQRSGQNLLLRSLCGVMLVAFLMIELGPLIFGVDPDLDESFRDFSVVQAIVLNYCFVSVQAHSSCMMINNCLLAMGWKFGRWDLIIDSTIVFIAFSTVVPLFPTCILFFKISDFATSTVYPFYAYVPANLMMLCTTIWYFSFAVPGNIATIYLMYKTVMVRRQTLEMTSHSQISSFQLLRLFVAMIAYMALSLGSAIPLLFFDEDRWVPPENFLASPALKSPWTNPKLCYPDAHTDDRFLYYYRARCPGPIAYFPIIVVIGIFLMYGFGTPVRAALRRMGSLGKRLFRTPRTEMSTGPMGSYSDSEYDLDSPTPSNIEDSENSGVRMERRTPKSRAKQL